MKAALRVPYKQVNGVGIPTDIHLPSCSGSPEPVSRSKNGLAPVLIMIHGGGFMLGSSKMNNADQIQDCLGRGWIVLSIEYRLCPGVDILEGPMSDSRDALRWVQNGGLANSLEKACGAPAAPVQADPDRVMVMGASAGGHLSLCMAWGVEKPPIAILDFYGPKHFNHPFWLQPIEQVKSGLQLPPPPPDSVYEQLYQRRETFIGGVSLEGQAKDLETTHPPAALQSELELDEKRQSFAMQAVANGRVLQSIWPPFPDKLALVDPALNVHASWPPTAIVHGDADFMVPMHLSQDFVTTLKESGVEAELIEVDSEPHTFLGKMVKGSSTWETQRKGFDFLEKIVQRTYI